METEVFLSLTHSNSPFRGSPSVPFIGFRKPLNFLPSRPMKLERLSFLSVGTESLTFTVSSVIAAGAVRPRLDNFRRNIPSAAPRKESSIGVTGADEMYCSPCR